MISLAQLVSIWEGGGGQKIVGVKIFIPWPFFFCYQKIDLSLSGGERSKFRGNFVYLLQLYFIAIVSFCCASLLYSTTVIPVCTCYCTLKAAPPLRTCYCTLKAAPPLCTCYCTLFCTRRKSGDCRFLLQYHLKI